MAGYFEFTQPQWFLFGEGIVIASDAEGRGQAPLPPPVGVPFLGVIPAGAVLPIDDSDAGSPQFANVAVPTAPELITWPVDDPEVGRVVHEPGANVHIEVLDYEEGIKRFPDARFPTQEELDAWFEEDSDGTF